MAIARLARLGRQAKRPHGLCLKMSAVAILGLCFVFIWSMFSSPANSVTTQRESFDDVSQPVAANTKVNGSQTQSQEKSLEKHNQEDKKAKLESDLGKKDEKKVNGSVSVSVRKHESKKRNEKDVKKDKHNVKSPNEKTENDDVEKENDEEEEGLVVDGKEEEFDSEGEVIVDSEGNDDLIQQENGESGEKVEGESGGSRSTGEKRKIKGPVFYPKAHYSWKLCSTRSKQNYIPCIDIESGTARFLNYRHRERSCPRSPPMCLVPLPHTGYGPPVPWPDSKSKILYMNVVHPKLVAYIKKHNWLVEDGEYLTFPQNQSEFKGGVLHYLESIEEDDLVDLAQVSLERGFPTVVSPFGSRRLPFPSGAFDAIHCGGCSILWHSNGGKLLLEMNRILRPGGYFILSTMHDSIEEEEAMTTLTSSICWNILAHKTDEVSEVGVKIYQKPESNDIYELRRKKNPPLCKENENPDAAWYVHMKTCLHTIPSSIEQHGAEWPEEWPKRLETYPDWLNDKEKLIADTNHWKAIIEKSYLTGMGIDWSKIRNVMDMKAINGGFAAALRQQKVWVMNVVPVHAPDTLPVIYDRGLIGVYHDWCESFGSYPRSYDLLHADHLFSRLKNRCKKPVSIVVEMDRLLRPGGWVIVRDKVEILDPLEGILRSMHWEIRLTYAQNKEGILCAQKTLWRP
ncbi:probable methyltransferase PMT28 isoform X2 [Mangifera indica]|uniref:probable methyltransferase PMT28 isoform X2 n=1 Tax=Mangifera indica TaxID=29780 RepID=UPI001CFB56F3|nr:probable methyltransferase PMT28 isoform X2 [Mangifera indica]